MEVITQRAVVEAAVEEIEVSPTQEEISLQVELVET